ncbi:MAG: MFS transporter [Parachlamydiaceae bacterium]|nr:MFS transporter [Parachlamydiaceae bacterium]
MDRISRLFLVSRLFCAPLEAIYTLLIFIAAGELHLNYFQLGLLAASKPVSSLLSFYASASVNGKPHLFKSYLILVNTVVALPALAFPFIDNGWFYIFAHLLFMAGQRAVFPIWNAMISGSLSYSNLCQLQGKAIALQQSIIIFCPLLFGYWIDADKDIWRQLFFALSLVQLLNSALLQFQNFSKFSSNKANFESGDLKTDRSAEFVENISKIKLGQQFSISSLVAPWKACWKLLCDVPAFRQYHQLFFLGGAGLVMMQSTLPIYFKENLHISYASIALAVSCCKGVALISSTKIWAFWVNKISLFRLNFFINLFSTLFIIFILISNYHPFWIFPAYLLYGTMQSGCEFSWNLCGPYFARGKETTLYSSLNLPLVGLRGVIFPFVGQAILLLTGANMVFITAGLLCLAGMWYARSLDTSLTQKLA